MLRREKERLEKVTARQRAELEGVVGDRWRPSSGLSGEPAHVADLLRLQAGHLGAERRRLARELQALRQDDPTVIAHDTAIKALLVELDANRMTRALAEEEARLAEAELANARSKAVVMQPERAAHAFVPALGAEGKESLRLRFRQESEARRQEARDLWVANADYEVLRNELNEATTEGEALRTGLRRTLRSLEQIQQESEEADHLVGGLPAPAPRGRYASPRLPVR